MVLSFLNPGEQGPFCLTDRDLVLLTIHFTGYSKQNQEGENASMKPTRGNHEFESKARPLESVTIP